jgi:poly(ADP-ribose) glycohydrolase
MIQGCGAFEGNKQLKSIIQWISCSETDCEMIYYTFSDDKLTNEIQEMVDLLKDLTVGEVYQLAVNYKNSEMYPKELFFNYLKLSISEK